MTDSCDKVLTPPQPAEKTRKTTTAEIIAGFLPMIIRKPDSKDQWILLISVQPLRTGICEEIGSDKPAALVETIEIVADGDESSANDGDLQSREEKGQAYPGDGQTDTTLTIQHGGTNAKVRVYNVQPWR